MKIAVVFGLVATLLASSVTAQERFLLAAEDDWYPYSAKSGEQAVGRSVEIVKAAYAAVGALLTLEAVPFNRGMVKTKEGVYAGVFNAGLNEDVLHDYLIPRNHVALSEQVAVARRAEPFVGKQSFNGKRLVLTNGYTYPVDITRDQRNSLYSAIGEINSLKMIAAGRADFTIIDRLVLMSILAQEPKLKQELEIVGELHVEKIYVLFSRNGSGEKARAAFDQGMDTINSNGILNTIINKWESKLR